MYDPYAEFVKTTLPNGLEVHSLYEDRPWVKIDFLVHAGSREDPIEKPGLAHFVEHMVSQNIDGVSSQELRDYLSDNGADADLGGTNYVSTKYSFTVLNDPKVIRQALQYFGYMLLHEKMHQCLSKEKKVILQEFNRAYPIIDELDWILRVRKSLYGGHKMATKNRPLGTPESFMDFSYEDLQVFYDEFYVPANISVVVFGGINTEETIRLIEDSPFGLEKAGSRNPIPQPFQDIKPPIEPDVLIKFSDYADLKKDNTDVKLSWFVPVLNDETGRIFSGMINRILFEEIREKLGLTYSISSSYLDLQDSGVVTIKGSIKSHATDQIADLVQGCIEKVRGNMELFSKKKQACKNRIILSDYSGADIVAGVVSDLRYNQRIITNNEALTELDRVTIDDVNRIVDLLTPEMRQSFIICP